MAFAHNFNAAATHVFFLCVLVVSLKTSMNASAATWSFRDEGNPVIKKYTVRDTVKIAYKATIEDVVRRSLKSGYWTLNSSIILRDGGDLEIGNTTEKGKEKFWLKIRKADIRNSGLYSFMINGSVLRQWEVHVTRGYEEPFSSCGRPLRRQVTHCVHDSYPDCKSFPGSPLNVNVSSHSLKGKPIIEVTWEPPTKGRNDLWGYQVHVVGKDFHAGHSQCQQINNKTGNLHSKFTKHIRYGAAYQVIVQSMPWYSSEDGADTNEVSREIRLIDMCEIRSKSLQCCSLINVTAEYSDKKITLAWGLPLQEECRQLDIFRVRWTNLQKPKQCVGKREIKGKFNYTIHLNKECSRFNYSIKLDGGSKKADQWSKTSKMIILIPPPELGPPSGTAFPVVDVYPRNQTVLEGRPTVMNCAAKGIPRPVLSWTFNDGEPPPDAEMRTFSDQSILQLSKTSKSMEGWYKCKAKNKAGEACSNSTLHVLEKPTVTMTSKPLRSLLEGERLTLACQGNEATKEIRWTKDGVPVNTRVKIYPTGNNSTLVIEKVLTSDSR
ncbi:Down syndrome cell adhesion molecule homolog isoform X1 [Acropora millepora]|uniref:Down syndrome cell adhesion molecule homolog isoform X1 n=1 Tax=Acropora millepora TaxID=45264 RepID=UPI001CF23017|nr:Down syndrome cell adhesion molecule homolog isoform X1 [Acropora millepora]